VRRHAAILGGNGGTGKKIVIHEHKLDGYEHFWK
jgi:MinD superfamily P-loop ATPase